MDVFNIRQPRWYSSRNAEMVLLCLADLVAMLCAAWATVLMLKHFADAFSSGVPSAALSVLRDKWIKLLTFTSLAICAFIPLFIIGHYKKQRHTARDIGSALAVSMTCAALDYVASVHVWHIQPPSLLWLEWFLMAPCLSLGLRYGGSIFFAGQTDSISAITAPVAVALPASWAGWLRRTLHHGATQHVQRCIKRSIDVVGSLLLILLGLPMLLWIVVRIQASSGGPVFFQHQRVGRSGKMFPCYKFRTMAPNADVLLQDLLASDPAAKREWEGDFKLKHDPRITAIGHFLRRSSIDELPQLWNVLKGDMSLVGPRPVVNAELARYGDALPSYLAHRPGITGLWQISGRNDTSYAARVQLDATYVKNWTILTDFAILLKTVKVVFAQQGSY